MDCLSRGISITDRVSVSQNIVWRDDREAFGENAPTQTGPPGAYPVTINLPPGTYAAFQRDDHNPARIELDNVPNAQNVQTGPHRMTNHDDCSVGWTNPILNDAP
jgi:hypothetical protein